MSSVQIRVQISRSWSAMDGQSMLRRPITLLGTSLTSWALASLLSIALAACGGTDASDVGIDSSGVADKVCSGPASSGWCWQHPLPQSQALFAFALPDDA